MYVYLNILLNTYRPSEPPEPFQTTCNSQETGPSNKKLRLSPAHEPEPKRSVDNKGTHKLPPLLSPEDVPKRRGLPPLLSPGGFLNRHGLPHQLSPTLPVSIEKEIRRLENTSNSFETRLPSAERVPAGKRLPTIKDNTQSFGLDETTHKAGLSTAPDSTPLLKGTASDGLSTGHHQSDFKASSQIVKLKFSKRSRREFERLIKLPPRATSIRNDSKTSQERAITSRNEPKLQEHNAGNRYSSPDFQKHEKQVNNYGNISPKQQKTSHSSKLSPNHRTPTHVPQASPPLSNASNAIKNRHLTPGKTALGMPLKRTISGDSLGTTPQGSVSTPAANRTVPSGTSSLGEEWNRIGRDLNGSARDVKRAAQDLLRQEEPLSHKKGALKAMEALL